MQCVIEQDNDNQVRGRLGGDDGTELAISAAGFTSAKAARSAATEVHAHAGSATGIER